MRIKPVLAALFGLAAWLGLGLALPAAADDGWSHYRNDELTAAIDFPAQPTITSEPGGDGQLKWTTTTAYYARGEQAFFGLSATQYQVDAAVIDPAKALDGSIEGMTSTMKMTVVSRTELKLADGVGAEILARVPDRDYMIRSHFEFHGNRLYQVMVIGAGKLPPETDRFIASFRYGAGS